MGSRREGAAPLASAVSLDAVAVFVEVVRARSFTGAARHLGLPKSTVSVRVAELEERLGVALLHRTTRRVQPTPAGESYFTAAARSITELHAAGQEASRTQEEPSGSLRVTSTGFGNGPIGDCIADYLARYPKVSVELWLTEQRLDLLAENVDVAFRIGPVEGDPKLTAHRLGSVELGLYASPAYLQEHGEPAHPDAIDRHAILISSKRRRIQLVHVDGRRCELKLSPRFTSNNMAAIRHQALRGVGVAVLARGLVESEVQAGDLIRVLDGWSLGTASVHLVYAKQRHLPRRVRLFVDLALAQMRPAAEGIRPRRSPG